MQRVNQILIILLFSIYSVHHSFYVLSLDVKPQKELYTPDYSVYHNFSSISTTIDNIIQQSSLVHIFVPKYFSRYNNVQHVLRLTTDVNKPSSVGGTLKVLLSFGEHAREFLPIEVLFHLLKQWIKPGFSKSAQLDFNKIDIYVIVLGNPDGRHYVEKTQNYCWRGTRTGVDLNRNFDWEYGGKGSSGDANDEEYRGTHVFSEPETQIYRDLTEKIQFDAFLSLHSGIRQIYVPYADSRSRQTGREPDNFEEMLKLAKLMATSTKHHFQYGKAAALNDYSADGTIFDYMAGVRKIPFSYAIELWGPLKHNSASCFDLFNPPNEQLHTVTEEIFPLFMTFFQYLYEWKFKEKTELKKPIPVHDIDAYNLPVLEQQIAHEVPSLSPMYILLCVLLTFTLLVLLHEKYPFCWRFYQRRRIINLRALSSSLSLNLFKS